MRTLYMTDLDGTLLRSDKTVSAKSVAVFKELAAAGCLFSVCTARGLHGIAMLPLQDIPFTAPMVLMNGVLLFDPHTKRLVERLEMPPAVIARVVAICERHGKAPFIYRPEGERLVTDYIAPTSQGEREFLEARIPRFPEEFRQLSAHDLTRSGVYFTMQDTHERLSALRQELQATVPEVGSVLYKDNYLPGNWFLEIFDCHAGKDNGVKRVQALTGADRLVVFGDNTNDLPMLEVADIACVVSTGVEMARRAADVIIGSHDEDGVALFMQQDFTGGCGA